MKKKIIILVLILCVSTINVFATSSSFSVDLERIFSLNSKTNELGSLFNPAFAITGEIESEPINREFEELVKRTTYILLGSPDDIQETPEEFYRRKMDFFDLRYAPEIPTTDDPEKQSFGGFDRTSQEYLDDLLSGINVPGIWNVVVNLEIDYDYIGNVRIIEQDDEFISSVNIPNVRYKTACEENPMDFRYIVADLTMYYIFKKNIYMNNEYQLLYLFGEFSNQLEDYFEDLESTENRGIVGMRTSFDSQLAEMYDFSQLNNLSDYSLQNIYDENIDKIMILSTYFNKSIIDTGTGFLLTNNVLVTSWSYLENALINGQHISVRDRNRNVFVLEGIITIAPDLDMALIKISDTNRTGVRLGDSTLMSTENPIISFSSKSGLGISGTAGIVMNNNNRLQNLLPLSSSDKGSPLFNSNGEVIGINTGESINTSVSYANHTDNLRDLQNKFNSTNNIESVPFEEMKTHYFTQNNEEVVRNNVSKRIWNRYSRIGNINENIFLPLIKANYSRGILSLRYDNSISNFIDNLGVTTSFVNELINDGYREILNTNEKSVYQNNRYRVIIMNEFDYLIIVMVRL